jgi:hypothetical protein
MAFYLKRDPDGVRVQGIKPETVPILLVARDVFAEHGKDCVWTGGTEDGHDTIIHPLGFAMDFRINHIDSVEASEIAGEIAARLNIKEYDVVLKSNHIHVEFDPR